CCIVEPTELIRKNNRLWAVNMPIDLVYNRLTDFDLTEAKHSTLQQAYIQDEIVLTPHPYAYALYANKRNLALLSDADLLKSCGIEKKVITQLQQVIPQTCTVNPKNTESLWQHRKQLFFKPLASHGGKGVYRGKNITTRVFKEIL